MARGPLARNTQLDLEIRIWVEIRVWLPKGAETLGTDRDKNRTSLKPEGALESDLLR